MAGRWRPFRPAGGRKHRRNRHQPEGGRRNDHPRHRRILPDYADAVNQPADEALHFPEGGLPAAALAVPPEIAALAADVHIVKHHWSAFYGTEMDLQLRRRGIRTVILAGVATNFGVESTIRDAFAHNYAVIAAEDAMTSFSPEMHDFSCRYILPRLARIRKTAEIVASI